jgi:hypothetical protein
MRSLLLLSTLSGAAACQEYNFNHDEREDGGDRGAVLSEPESRFDNWNLDELPGTDVLFFGDTSGSMATELTTLGDLVGTFVTRMEDYTTTWQLLAVTGPSGCGVQGVITPDTPDYASVFAQAILTPPGEDEVDEWGLYNVAQAVQQSDEGECNAGFLREDAVLHVIFISDEDDNSPGWDTDAGYWQGYVDAVLAAKSDPSLVRMSAVVGPVPDGCEGAEPGTGYAEAVEATGGELISICTDWANELDLLVQASIMRSDFALSAWPIVPSISVVVNGEAREEGWEYVGADNLVRFLEELPRSGDRVTIGYRVSDG